MKPKRLLPRLQDPAACAYPEPDQSSQHPRSTF